MKIHFFLTALLLLFLMEKPLAQPKFLTKDGKASFFSEAPLENIEAHNSTVRSVLDLANNRIAVTMRIRDFKFDKSLMEEHFNENYMESEQYPEAKFSGSFPPIAELSALKDGTYEILVKGQLTIHGVTRDISTPAKIKVEKGNLSGSTQFKVALADYQIEIPKLVFKNIAEIVDVSISLPFEEITH